MGVTWEIIQYFFYRDPADSAKVNETEIKHVEEGGRLVARKNTLNKSQPEPFQWNDLKEVFMNKKLWGIYLGQFVIGYTLWGFSYLVSDLVKYWHINFIQSDFFTYLPFLSACRNFTGRFFIR